VRRLRFAPFAVFFQVDLSLNLLPVLAAPIIDPLAFTAREFYEFIL